MSSDSVTLKCSAILSFPPKIISDRPTGARDEMRGPFQMGFSFQPEGEQGSVFLKLKLQVVPVWFLRFGLHSKLPEYHQAWPESQPGNERNSVYE